ncbi:hypothetical protein VMT65_30925 [Nocardia sp. CDC153]|uniref:hypothetical protein n=1 Tax=Nocardia sp. CDC153 TaxID=3112167 RepID=UPI002DB8E1A6|nr:hypothetical protein [Nocardia sp. CDC153]MEC3957482.1 hypothetical protein [Nocardia sp. CDC153]
MRDTVRPRATRRRARHHPNEGRVVAVWPEPSPLQDWWDTVMFGPGAVPDWKPADSNLSADS